MGKEEMLSSVFLPVYKGFYMGKKEIIVWVRGLVVKTVGYSTEGPKFDSHSKC